MVPLRTEIELVCFDLGGVLVRICHGWSEACRAAGVAEPSEVPTAVRQRAKELGARYQTGSLTSASWLEQSVEACEGAYTREQLERIIDAWIIGEYEGVGDLLDGLHRARIATACLSNTVEGHWRRLVHADGGRPLPGVPEFPSLLRLQSRFASHLLNLAKPDPAIYHAMREQVGVPAQRILFFDDLPENVAAARDVGWNAERVDPSIETIPQIREKLRAYGII